MNGRNEGEPCSIGEELSGGEKEGFAYRMQIGLREEICNRTTAAQCGRTACALECNRLVAMAKVIIDI